ncbi:MAG: hypothetical protein D6714_15260 [Bacteroidetes bacterium]|nr:MAG: hypothetical protein D6714_15260 [Bacteroidota bacterium]
MGEKQPRACARFAASMFAAPAFCPRSFRLNKKRTGDPLSRAAGSGFSIQYRAVTDPVLIHFSY